jgi:hypothetical protein
MLELLMIFTNKKTTVALISDMTKAIEPSVLHNI